MSDGEEVFSSSERNSLDGFTDQVDLAAFWLTDHDRAEVVGWRRTDPARLAAGIQIGALRLMGYIPSDLATAPAGIVALVAEQLELQPEILDGYRPPPRTLRDHIRTVERYLGFRRCDRGDLKALGDWLVLRAMEHDRPITLFGLACEHLRAARLVRPAVNALERLIATARQRAFDETWIKLQPVLTEDQLEAMDALLEFDDTLGATGLVWLCQQSSTSVPTMVREQLAKLEQTRAIGVDTETVSLLPANRVRHLARLGQRHSPQALRRSRPSRRHQIVACTLAELVTALTDEVLELFDTAIGATVRRARNAVDTAQQRKAASTKTILAQFERIGSLVINDSIPDSELRTVILASVTAEELRATVDESSELLAPDSVRQLEELRSRYTKLRQHAPHVIEAFDFLADQTDAELLKALRLLRDLNAKGLRRVPDDAPIGFVPNKWRDHVTTETGQIDRKSWEISLLLEIRAALRAANLWVDQSRRFANPRNYLLDDHTWEHHRSTNPTPTATERLEQLDARLTAEIGALDETLADRESVRIENDRIIITPLKAIDTSHDQQLRDQVIASLPELSLIELLVEVNSWCGFLDHFTHAANSTSRHDHHSARLLATILANGTNLGIADMARSSHFSADQLEWTQTWHLRPETIAAANNTIVNHHHNQPLTRIWGKGTLSSSDGQRFPFAVRNPNARALRRYFTGTGATIYTWTADHHIQYGTRVIPTTVREATYVLDAILDNETDLQIEEHTTDTAGYTDLVYGLFDFCGLRFSPRLRDLNDQRLWRLPTTPTDTPAAELIRHRIKPALIAEHWNDMQRVAATIRTGHTSASMLIAKLQASARQNELTKAIQEHGRIIKTISILRYLSDTNHRRKIHRQLNKGESLHALRRRLFFANLGQLTRRRTDDQDVQAQCLTLLTNAVIAWNTTYLQAAIEHLDLPQESAEHIAPSISRHIDLYGQYDFLTPQPPKPGTLRPLTVTKPQT